MRPWILEWNGGVGWEGGRGGELHGVRVMIDADILREGERNLNNAGFVVNLEL